MKSAIYTGTLHHRRTQPKVHDFQYQVAMFYLDLDELPRVFSTRFLFSMRSPSLLRFDRKDYLSGKPNLKEAVYDLVEAQTGERPSGPVRMLTQIRYFGFCFNPVTFYYCFDAKGEKLEYIATEITNTPWNERMPHAFKFEGRDFEFKKNFHVSPFFKMDFLYRWKFNEPTPVDLKSAIRVQMENLEIKADESPGDRVFLANLVLKPKPLTPISVSVTVLAFPLLTVKAFLGIYWQALLIFLKGVPFVPHPKGGIK
jgi:hypothetical protein